MTISISITLSIYLSFYIYIYIYLSIYLSICLETCCRLKTDAVQGGLPFGNPVEGPGVVPQHVELQLLAGLYPNQEKSTARAQHPDPLPGKLGSASELPSLLGSSPRSSPARWLAEVVQSTRGSGTGSPSRTGLVTDLNRFRLNEGGCSDLRRFVTFDSRHGPLPNPQVCTLHSAP